MGQNWHIYMCWLLLKDKNIWILIEYTIPMKRCSTSLMLIMWLISFTLMQSLTVSKQSRSELVNVHGCSNYSCGKCLRSSKNGLFHSYFYKYIFPSLGYACGIESPGILAYFSPFLWVFFSTSFIKIQFTCSTV